VRQTIFLASIVLITACATNASREPQALVAGNAAAFVAGVSRALTAPPAQALEAPESFTALKTVTSDEADNGRVCEYRPRPGSHITEKYCYTRQQHAANQEVRDETVRQQVGELQREQRLQEEAWRQMEMERNRRPFGR
jgi:hypothetical protein